jgi:serine/threonine-protein kinase HipA
MKNYKNKNAQYRALATQKDLNYGLVQEPETAYEKTLAKANTCYYCYKAIDCEDSYHATCAKKFFGQGYIPQLSYSKAELAELAQKYINTHMAVTGVQPKVSLSWYRKQEKNTLKKLTIVGLYGDYILKPPSDYYRCLPELEDCTMKMAEVCGLKTVPHTLFRLADGTVCYLTKRVDRTKTGMLHMEDMCQVLERMTEDKYKGSHEQIAKALLKYSATPLLDVGNFYEYVVFCFFAGNADMHLKNFSLLETEPDQYVLCPAYDMLSTALVNPADTEELALTLNGKKSKLKYQDFLMAFNNAGLSQKYLDKTLENFYYCKLEMLEVIKMSFLPDDLKQAYMILLNQRYGRLGLS